MPLRIFLERYAEEDFTGHVDYLAQERPAAALTFIDAIERAFARLAELPEIGSPRAFQNSRLEASACGRCRSSRIT